MLDLDSQVQLQPDAKYQHLDAILYDAQKRIHWNPAEPDQAKRRAQALEALQTIQHILIEHNILYPPTGDILNMSQGLDLHKFSSGETGRSETIHAAARNPQEAMVWLQAHRSEDFRFMDCDVRCFVYLAIGQATSMPIHLVLLPTHAFVRVSIGDGAISYVNWDVTSGTETSDDYFRRQYHVSTLNQQQRLYMADLTPPELLGYYLYCRAMWQADMSPPRRVTEAADLKVSIDKYPQFDLSRNELAWLYLSVPGLRKGTTQETLKLALSALAISPEDPTITDTVACAYAEFGDFDKAISYENEALRLNDADTQSDPRDKTADRADYTARLTLFKNHKTYLQSLNTNPNGTNP